MPATLESLLDSANDEWKHWGKSTWDVAARTRSIGHTDDEAVFAQYVIDNYNSVGGGAPTIEQIADDQYFWSAVGMSAIFSGAGFKKPQFPFAQAHSVWIRRFIKDRATGINGLYHGFRLGEAEATPDVGDLIAYGRGKGMTFAKAQVLFDATSSYQSHSDLVVARRPGEIDVIGCNVLDSVTKKTLKLDGKGLIADRTHNWFAVLKRRGF